MIDNLLKILVRNLVLTLSFSSTKNCVYLFNIPIYITVNKSNV